MALLPKCGIIPQHFAMSRLAINANQVRQVLSHHYLTLATRIGLGGIFIFAGVAKLPYLDRFAWSVNEYGILPYSLAKGYAYSLPGLEVALGILLVLGLFLRFSALISILVTLSFIIANSVALAQGETIPYCYCFGDVRPLLMRHSLSLGIDIVLLAMAFQILFHRRDFLALGPWLSQRAAEAEEE